MRSSYPTWCLKVWIDNEESTYDLYYNELSYLDEFELADRIKEDVEREADESKIYGFLSDILTWSLEQVDYLEIAEDIVAAREE